MHWPSHSAFLSWIFPSAHKPNSLHRSLTRSARDRHPATELELSKLLFSRNVFCFAPALSVEEAGWCLDLRQVARWRAGRANPREEGRGFVAPGYLSFVLSPSRCHLLPFLLVS
ncbi:hypothetical protein BJX66DRAFT_306440 [Aspergillus keveii]|uniref:Uncharacterized protein n=1 Tax=Aspergillus keveii TaxID=714993 RepID=A0ABR4G2P1_9EURO